MIAKDSLKYAQITVRNIFAEAEKLHDFPEIGRIVPELNNKKIRELIYGNYRVIYEYSDLTVSILTIHHSARNLNTANL